MPPSKTDTSKAESPHTMAPNPYEAEIVVRHKRREAARARRMALYLANGDKRTLCAYAEELEAEAEQLELQLHSSR